MTAQVTLEQAREFLLKQTPADFEILLTIISNLKMWDADESVEIALREIFNEAVLKQTGNRILSKRRFADVLEPAPAQVTRLFD